VGTIERNMGWGNVYARPREKAKTVIIKHFPRSHALDWWMGFNGVSRRWSSGSALLKIFFDLKDASGQRKYVDGQ